MAPLAVGETKRDNLFMSNNERYSRQIVLPEVRETGQARLSGARVLVVGAGALGTPALYYLAAAGVGRIGVADDDTLELSNLHRQILYSASDIGRPKAQAAGERLIEFNPEVQVQTHRLRVTADNAVTLFHDYDLVLDCTDRLETKFLINDACAKAERPLVHAAILGFEARVAVFHARTGPCLRCLFPEPPTAPALTCAQAGVLGAVTGMAGSLQALEAIKWILDESPSNSPFPTSLARGRTGSALPDGGKRETSLALPLGRIAAKGRNDDESSLQSLLGWLWIMDGRTMHTRVVELPRDPACRICRHAPKDIELLREATPVRRITAQNIAQHVGALLIDVREDEEWAAGHLDGAIHCPLSRLMDTSPALPEHSAYIAYCAHGIRSETAARLLLEAGYRNVFSLSGGIAAVHGDDAKKPQ